MFRQIQLFQHTLTFEKRLRYAPIWKKFYTVYKFDYSVYHRLCNDICEKEYFRWIVINYLRFYSQDINLLAYFMLVNALRKFEEPKIRELCFILDAEGKKQFLSDEKHIFRVRTLQNIYTKLFEYAEFPLFVNNFSVKAAQTAKELSFSDAALLCKVEQLQKQGFRVHFDNDTTLSPQLEIAGTEMLPIKERLKAHIELLRYLKNGGRLMRYEKHLRKE